MFVKLLLELTGPPVELKAGAIPVIQTIITSAKVTALIVKLHVFERGLGSKRQNDVKRTTNII